MLKFSLVFSILALGACTEEPTVHSSTSPVTCSGSCDFDASAGDRDVGVFATVTGGTVAWSGGAWFIPIVEPAGTSLTSVSMTIVDLTGNPVIARFTVNGQTVGSAQSSGTGATQTLVVPIGRIVASGDVDALVLIPTDTSDTRKETASTGHVSTVPAVPVTPTAVRSISALVGRPFASQVSWTTAVGMVRWSSNDWIVPISDGFDVGDQLLSVQAVVNDNLQSTVTMEIFFDRIGDSSGVLAGPTTSIGNFTVQNLTACCVNYTLRTSETLTAKFTATGPNPVQLGTLNIAYVPKALN